MNNITEFPNDIKLSLQEQYKYMDNIRDLDPPFDELAELLAKPIKIQKYIDLDEDWIL